MRRLFKARLIEHHRRRARLLLYLGPLVILGASWITVQVLSKTDFKLNQDWQKIDFSQYESVRLFQRYLQINTSYPTGNEIPAAEFLARELEKEGLKAHVERLGHRNANIWAILEGEDPSALVLHNHMDVDPIQNPQLWRIPPFSGLIEMPFIYGRGAFDMKSLGIAQLMAVKKVRRAGKPLRRSLIFLATGDEERESWHGTRWILREHPELAERFGAVLTEGGAVEATDIGVVKYWGTEHRQKLFVEMRICSDNLEALEALQDDFFVRDYERGHPDQLPPRIVDELRTYVYTRAMPEFQARFESALYWRGGFSILPANVRAMMRHDLGIFPVAPDPGGGYSLRLILHLLPWESVEEGWKRVLPQGLPGYTVSYEIPHPPIPLEGLDHPIFDHIDQHMRRAYPDFVHGPLFVPWAATDARFFRAAGIPAYGFSPFLILTGDASKMTGPNERLVAPAFAAGVELYEEIVQTWVQ